MAWRNPGWAALQGRDQKPLRRIFQSLGNKLDDVDASVLTKLDTPAYTTWTPALTAVTTNPTLGTSPTTDGRYIQVADLVVAQFVIAFGTGGSVNAGSGVYSISLPVTAFASIDTSNGMPIGLVRLVDNSTGNIGIFTLRQNSTTTCAIQYPAAWPTGAVSGVAHNVPWTWAASDRLVGSMVYEAA